MVARGDGAVPSVSMRLLIALGIRHVHAKRQAAIDETAEPAADGAVL